MDRLEAQLAEVRALREDPRSPAALKILRTALAKRPCHVVALAARHVAEHELRELCPDLAKAYERLHPTKNDPGCTGKLAIVEALSALDHPDEAPFLHAVGHVQLEKAWGPPVDTAVALRGQALMALVGLNHPDVPLLIGERLADPEPRVQSDAVRCLAAWADPVLGLALIRLRSKVRVGEPHEDAEVRPDLFEAALTLDRERSTPWVVGHLLVDDASTEAAALALGTKRIDEALPALIGWWERAPQSRKVAVVAIGLLRTPEALGFLLERIRTDWRGDALAALEAARVYVHDPASLARIREAARAAGLEDALDALL